MSGVPFVIARSAATKQSSDRGADLDCVAALARTAVVFDRKERLRVFCTR